MVELLSTKCDDLKLVPFANDFSATEKLKSLLQWWAILLELGPKFGYFSEPAKYWLITNYETNSIGKELCRDTKLKKINSGKRFLGSAIGKFIFKKQYIYEIASQWLSKIKVLSHIPKVEPQAAYCCFTTGFRRKLTYLIRTTSNINEELRRLDDAITNKLIPSFTENKVCGNGE